MKNFRDGLELAVTQLFVGFCSGYISYMRGIQKADVLLLVNWFILAPLLALSSGLARESRPRVSKIVAVVCLVGPMLSLVGFSGAYNYPVWKPGLWYVLGSGVFSITSYILGATVISRRVEWTRRFAVIFRRSFVVSAMILVGAVLYVFPMSYESVNVLDYFGQGVLNSKDDDIQFVLNMDNDTRVGYLDGWEVPSSNPDIAREIGFDYHRRYWLGGPILYWLGHGYEFGNPPKDSDKSLSSH